MATSISLINSQQDYSSMSLAELKQKQAENAAQAQANIELYPELAAQYQIMDKQLESEIVKKSFSTNNNSFFGFGFQFGQDSLSLGNQDYSRMSLSQLEDEKERVTEEAQKAAEDYPETAEKYVKIIKKIDRAIDIKEYGPVKGRELASIDDLGNDVSFALQMLTTKRVILKFQAESTTKSELLEQYHIMDKQYEAQERTLQAKADNLTARRDKFIDNNHKIAENDLADQFGIGQNQSNDLMNMLMMFVQALFGANSSSSGNNNYDFDWAQWQTDNNLK